MRKIWSNYYNLIWHFEKTTDSNYQLCFHARNEKWQRLERKRCQLNSDRAWRMTCVLILSACGAPDHWSFGRISVYFSDQIALQFENTFLIQTIHETLFEEETQKTGFRANKLNSFPYRENFKTRDWRKCDN